MANTTGKKFGGRTLGTENKTSAKQRELFTKILEGEVDSIQEAFKKVKKEDPAKYLDLFAKYAQYFIPKKTEVDNTHTFENAAIINWTNSSSDTEKTKY